ncbi:type II secretion system F family protein [Streptomyces sp. TR02-1]|uniref:type II secretion system F family protein n=1 Tax=Streptomyces sp. TR02-1 TaxID=3385977 RepID=UPI0039A1CB76
MRTTLVAGAGGSGGATPLWWVLALAMASGAAAVGFLGWRERYVRRRRRQTVLGPVRAGPGGPLRSVRRAAARSGDLGRPGGSGRQLLQNVGAVLGGAACGAVAVGGTAGGWGGAVVGLAAWHYHHRSRRRTGNVADRAAALARAREVERRLPLASELLAACLAAGSSTVEAARAVGRSTGGPLGEGLVHAATQLRLGARPSDVWQRFGETPGCEGLARCLERAGSSGVPPVAAVIRLAAECRARRARRATARARRVAVQVTGPLGLCFLPAFLALGVAPVVVGLARSLL